MAITLTIKNYNEHVDRIDVYRSESPFAEDELPSLLDTCVPGTEEYTDTGTQRNVLYYYRLVVVSGDQSAVSKQTAILATDRLGHGPTDLKAGDHSHGYFGTLSRAEFIDTAAQMNALTGQSMATEDPSTMFKFALNGKILLVSRFPFNEHMSWQRLYDAGMVYGVDGPGPIPENVSPVDQDCTVMLDGYLYRVRLIRGFNPSWPENTGTEDSEWALLLNQISGTLYDTQREPNWDNSAIRITDNADIKALTMERSEEYAYGRRGAYLGYQHVENPTESKNNYWYPVFELVP